MGSGWHGKVRDALGVLKGCIALPPSPMGSIQAGQPGWLQAAFGAAKRPLGLQLLCQSLGRRPVLPAGQAAQPPPPASSILLPAAGLLPGSAYLGHAPGAEHGCPAILLPLQSCSSPCQAARDPPGCHLVPMAPVPCVGTGRNKLSRKAFCFDAGIAGLSCLGRLSPCRGKLIGFMEPEAGMALEHLVGHEVPSGYLCTGPRGSPLLGPHCHSGSPCPASIRRCRVHHFSVGSLTATNTSSQPKPVPIPGLSFAWFPFLGFGCPMPDPAGVCCYLPTFSLWVDVSAPGAFGGFSRDSCWLLADQGKIGWSLSSL